MQLFSRQVQDGMPVGANQQAVCGQIRGEFRFAELQPGTYKVLTNELMDGDPVTRSRVWSFGSSGLLPGVSDFASAGTITLTAGQTVRSICH